MLSGIKCHIKNKKYLKISMYYVIFDKPDIIQFSCGKNNFREQNNKNFR